MPSGFTENYGLNQWKKSDQVLMEDFNADNARIDEALKAAADGRAELAARAEQSTGALNAALDRKGNCEIWTTTYTGHGKYGEKNPNKVTFPRPPLFAVVMSQNGMTLFLTPGITGCITHGNSSVALGVTWSGNTVSWYGPDETFQLSSKGGLFYVFAWLKTD